jgi:hypothetical protein
MDPNEALRNAREALSRMRHELSFSQARDWNTIEEKAEDLADAFEALDGWLSKGGFLPSAWAPETDNIIRGTLDEFSRAHELQVVHPNLTLRQALDAVRAGANK